MAPKKWAQNVDAQGNELLNLDALTTSENDRLSSFSGQNLFVENGYLGAAADQGPWYDHEVATTTTIKESPVPCSSLEVVSPDGTETIVVATRDGTDEHTYVGEATVTFKQSRDQGESFSDIETLDLGSTIDPSRTGNGLIATDDTTLYFFDSQVDPRTSSNEATAVHRLRWDSLAKSWTITENVNRFKNYRMLPHFVEEGVIKVGYVDFTASPQEIQFAEYDPAAIRSPTWAS
ncbi:hypothetical protein ACFQMM_09790 [Saliphagus sp. GCM10025308]